jgi:hypothetical protein
MHFIQEIRFLKAYYWANLGKFAFTPEDRIEWTERAKKDFDALNIPADTYCNPDPGNIYYRGFQADLCTPQIRIDAKTDTNVSATLADGGSFGDQGTSDGKNIPNNVA